MEVRVLASAAAVTVAAADLLAAVVSLEPDVVAPRDLAKLLSELMDSAES